jgi:hypothetical protein
VSTNRIAGFALIVVGLFVGYTGYEMSQSVGNQLNEAFSGSPTDSVMIRYLAAVVCVGGGAYLAK